MHEPDVLDGLAAAVVAKAATAAFGKPLVTNVLRAMLVEAMIDTALPADWRWCSADYAGWDFEHASGIKLEVKQSASRQSWALEDSLPSKCRWDIAPRSQFWENSAWVQRIGRYADLYVLAHHPIAGIDADHREPAQWVFYVVATTQLPATLGLSLTAAQRLTDAVPYADLAAAVERARLVLVA